MTANTARAWEDVRALHERINVLESRLSTLERRLDRVAGSETEGMGASSSLPADADAAVAWLVNYKATDDL